VQPFERLRYLARWSSEDDGALVAEAADCLAGFADDPAGLVVACRRLLVHHASCGPLWWLCARVLAAPDPAEAAWEAARRVADDSTPERLAGALPFPHDDPVAVYGWPELSGAAMSIRSDLDIVAIRRPGRRDVPRRVGVGEPAIRVVNPAEAAALRPSHLLIEVHAAGARDALAPRGAEKLVEELTRDGAEAWLVAGVGRVLPERLFVSLREHLHDRANSSADDETVAIVSVERFNRIAGPVRLDTGDSLARRADCPVAPELLRLSG
jgi:hypothetical protein